MRNCSFLPFTSGSIFLSKDHHRPPPLALIHLPPSLTPIPAEGPFEQRHALPCSLPSRFGAVCARRRLSAARRRGDGRTRGHRHIPPQTRAWERVGRHRYHRCPAVPRTSVPPVHSFTGRTQWRIQARETGRRSRAPATGEVKRDNGYDGSSSRICGVFVIFEW